MKRVAMAVVAAVLLSGCAAGSSAAPDTVSAAPSVTPTPTATTMPAGKFKLTMLSGAEITFTLPTPATHPAVKDLEALRVKVGGDPVTYLVADVDNRKGSERVNMYQVSAFDAEGIQYTFSTVTDSLSSWGPSYGEDYKYKLPDGRVLDDAAGSALSSEATELHNANLNGAEKGERTKMVLTYTGTDLPKEFTRVSVQPSGMGEGEDATPAP